MKLSRRQRLILMGVLLDQRALAGMPLGSVLSMRRQELGRHRLQVRRAQDGLVPLSLERWLGHSPSNSDHVLCHRACLQLEGLGLLVRHSAYGGRRTTHLKLTPAGRRVAKRFLAEEYGLAGDDVDTSIDWSSVEFMPIEMPVGDDRAEHDGE